MKKKGLRAIHMKEYKAWRNMKYRCNTESCTLFHDYGARGISVCDRWQHSFENFFKDMGISPKGYSIDRINNNGNYEPDNCRWASWSTQANNKRRSGVFNVMEQFEMKIKEEYGDSYCDNFSEPIKCVNTREIMKSKKVQKRID